MEETLENGKEFSHSARANGMNEMNRLELQRGRWALMNLTLSHLYLKPYCLGRENVFFFSGHLIYILK
jgi:hypothetical protein